MSALLTNSVSDAIRAKDSEKFITFLDRACNGIVGDNVETYSSLKELLGKATTAINLKLQQAVNERAVHQMKMATASSISNNEVIDLEGDNIAVDGNSNFNVANSQFLEPRGRFNVSITTSGLLLQGKQSVFIPWNKVSHIARVPSHTSTKKEGDDILAIRLIDSGVKFNNKDMKSLLWVLENTVVNEVTQADTITEFVQSNWKHKIGRINKALFQSVLTQKPFLRCYNGIQEGGLYPLKCGILFIKPLVFIATEEIGTVVAGRGGGSGNTRYVDLQIETTDDRTIEFTNIDREELPSLQGYVKNYLEVRARQRAAATAALDSDPAVSSSQVNVDNTQSGVAHLLDMNPDEDEDDEDDEDFDPDNDSDSDARSSGSESSSDSEDNDDDDDDDDDDDSHSKHQSKNRASVSATSGKLGNRAKSLPKSTNSGQKRPSRPNDSSQRKKPKPSLDSKSNLVVLLDEDKKDIDRDDIVASDFVVEVNDD